MQPILVDVNVWSRHSVLTLVLQMSMAASCDTEVVLLAMVHIIQHSRA